MIQKINQINLKQNSKLKKIKQKENQTFASNPVKAQELMPKNLAQALKIQFTGEAKDWKYYETHIKPLAVKNISMYHLINNQMVSLSPITKMENGKPVGYYENYALIGEFDSSSKKYTGAKPEFQGKIFEYQKTEFQYDESNNAYRDEEKRDGYIYIAPDGSGVIFDKDLFKSKYSYLDKEKNKIIDDEIFKDLTIDQARQNIEYLTHCSGCDENENLLIAKMIQALELQLEKLEAKHAKALMEQGKILQAVEYMDNSKNREFITEKMREYLGLDNIKPKYFERYYSPVWDDDGIEFLNSTRRFSDVVEDIFKDLSIDEIKESISDLKRYDNEKNDKNSFCANVILALETNLVDRYMKQNKVYEAFYYAQDIKYGEFLEKFLSVYNRYFVRKIENLVREIECYNSKEGYTEKWERASQLPELEKLYEELESTSINLSIDELKQRIDDTNDIGFTSHTGVCYLQLEFNLLKAYIKQGEISKAIEYINGMRKLDHYKDLIIDRMYVFFKCNKNKKNPGGIDEDIFKDANINTLEENINYLKSYSNKDRIDKAWSEYSCSYNGEHVYLRECIIRHENKIKAIIAKVLPALEISLVKKYIEQGAISKAKKYINSSKNSEFLANRIGELFGLGRDFDFSLAHETELGNITINPNLNKKIEELQEALSKKVENSNEYANREIDDGIAARAIWDVATLGIYELARMNAKSSIEYKYLRDVHENSYSRQASLLYEQETNVLKMEKIIEFIQNFDSKIEETKSWLRKKYVDLVNRKDDYLKLPNCIMFTGENHVLAQHLAKWCATSTSSDFQIIEYNLDNNKAQEALYDALEASLENYESTGKRTIIYVESMERLLNPELNSDDNIADMKELMQCANEEYHATIIFNTNKPEKLNRESMSSNRVGLKVDNPITYDEANLRKYIEENNWEDSDYLLNKQLRGGK